MTLVCSYSIGGIASVITSDTRRVMTLGGKQIPIVDNDSKIRQLTDSIVCVGGGYDALIDFVVKNLKKELSTPINTLRIESIVKDIDDLLQKKFEKNIKKGMCAQILITGFTALGTTFTLNYNPSEEIEKRISYNILDYGIFIVSGAFPEGYEGTLYSLQEASNQIHANMTEVEMAQTLLLSIVKLQQAIHLASPDKVSEWLCYTIILRDQENKKPIIISDKVNIIPTESDEAVNE